VIYKAKYLQPLNRKIVNILLFDNQRFL